MLLRPPAGQQQLTQQVDALGIGLFVECDEEWCGQLSLQLQCLGLSVPVSGLLQVNQRCNGMSDN